MEIRTFPIYTQIGIFNNESEIENWLINDGNPLDYCFIKHSPTIYTSFINEIVLRYNYYKKGILSFSNIFDELPAWWIEAIEYIDSLLPEIMKAKEKHAKNN